MHVALIIDEDRLAQEPAMLERVAIGLIGEGITLTRVLPPSHDERDDAASPAIVSRLLTPMRVVPFVRSRVMSSIAGNLSRDLPDVMYAIGPSAWRFGIDLARRIDRPLALDVWSAPQIRQLPRGRRGRLVGGYITPTEALADGLAELIGRDLVYTVPFGVAIPPQPRVVFEQPARAISLAVIGGGRDVPAYRAMLGGLSRLIHEHPTTRAFIELRGPYDHEIWRHAQRLDLLEHISALSDADHHRALLTCCDVLVVPERYGELRSLMLEAMAIGMPVIASGDPYLMLVRDETALLIDQPEPEAWARGLRRLVSEPEAARAIGAAGREAVAAHNTSSLQASSLADALGRIAAGGNYAFREPVTRG